MLWVRPAGILHRGIAKMIIIEDVFEIKTRGTVISCRWPVHLTDLKIGDDIEIENPDGTSVKTTLIGVEHIRCLCTDNHNKFLGLLVRGFIKAQIQTGAKIRKVI